jgi:ATP-dependent Clp protease ATP-binding subunit ClpC
VSHVLEGSSVDAQRVVTVAIDEARRFGHAHVGTEHLLLGLLADEDGEAASALRAAGATLAAARHTVSEVVTETAGPSSDGEIPFTPRAQRALERAGRFSRRDRAPEVTTTHVLLGLLDVEGLACQVMRGLGVDLVRLRESVVDQPADVAPHDAEPTQTERASVRPRCPHCRADLHDHLAQTVVDLRADGDSETRVIYCAACGAALGFRDP